MQPSVTLKLCVVVQDHCDQVDGSSCAPQDGPFCTTPIKSKENPGKRREGSGAPAGRRCSERPMFCCVCRPDAGEPQSVLQLQPLQRSLTAACKVPQVPAARPRGEQGQESPGGSAPAGTGGKKKASLNFTQ